MRTNISLLPIKGIKTPDFKEPKGDEFQKVMDEIKCKVEEKRIIKNTSVEKINQVTAELNKVKNAIIMAEDKFEEIDLKKKRKALQDKLEGIEDYSGLDVEAFARKLIENPEVQQLQEEATAERITNREVLSIYEQAFKENYERLTRESNRYTAAVRNDSSYSAANHLFSLYKNN
ncbi:hypothetical protein [Trichococcus sp.]|uniref:hypothetical protein n=1 Tax=Trichococcus sp. TaxID=1985464 RepID=UPI003C7B5031